MIMQFNLQLLYMDEDVHTDDFYLYFILFCYFML